LPQTSMDWLKDHAYIATWLSPIIAIIIGLSKSTGKLARLNWQEFVGLFLLCSSIAIVMTPTFDDKARDFARMLAIFLLGYGVLQATWTRGQN
jgi:hypothetical protein